MKWLGYFFSFLLVLLLSGSVAQQNLMWKSSSSDGLLTPFQRELERGINERKEAGLPVPSVQFEYLATSEEGLQQMESNPTAPAKFSSRTTIEFEGPEQAGYTEWPPLITKENLPPELQATVREEDYSEAYRQFMEEKIPGYWDTYEFGHEPRKFTIVETIEISEPNDILSESNSKSIWPPAASGSFLTGATSPLLYIGNSALLAANTGQILTGFTYTGPNIDYTLNVKLEASTIDTPEVCVPPIGPIPGWCIPATQISVVVYDITAGFNTDWSLGLRLPASANLTGPNQLTRGNTYNNITSSLTPLDWSTTDFSNVGVAPEEGNEFVLRLKFFIGLKVELLEKDVCEVFGLTCNIDINENKSKSFTTPLGAGNSFSIDTLTIPIKEFRAGLFSWTIGLGVTPKIGSKQISADWLASGAASGNGEIIYSEPQQAKSIGSINACVTGNSNTTQIQLSNFKYHFTEFLMELAATSKVAIDPIDILLPDGISWPASIPITTFDLKPIFGSLGLSVGAHTQCTFDFKCTAKGPANTVNLNIPVKDLTLPSTTLTRSGTAGNNDWYRSNVQVSLSATDGPTGCNTGIKQTQYSFDGINWNTYTTPFTISAEGTTTVRYRSTDNANNVETFKTQTVKIDKTPPSITGAPTIPPNFYGWHNTDVIVHFSASDAVSGIATVTSDTNLSGEGTDQSVQGVARDMAGNTASVTVTGINIDKTPPAVSATSAPVANINGWNNTDVTVTYIGADTLSGIDFCDVAAVLSNEGDSQSASGSCFDRAGNSASTTVSGINIDKTPPLVSAIPAPAANANGWNNTDVIITYSGTDGLSGIDFCDVANLLSDEGTGQSASGSCFDLAGNSASATASGINIDKTPPTVSTSAAPAANINGWNNTDVIVTYSGVDSLSGIDSCDTQVLSNEGADQTSNGSCTDLAGNNAFTTVTGINIDKTSPVLSITSPENKIYENTETFNVIWNATDDLSGVFSEHGNLDGNTVVNGDLIELLTFSPEPHTLTVDVIDKANNTASASVVFNISIDSRGLLALVKYTCDLGWINKPGICNSLSVKLNAAIRSVDRGNLNAAENQLNAFLNELDAQKDKSINQTAYDMLRTGALYVIDHLH